ncbi:hypothetical protein ACFUVV_04045 [Streptomyces sp. NPDC057376]|nr:hypothetical protein [Streptomyces sp. CB02414]
MTRAIALVMLGRIPVIGKGTPAPQEPAGPPANADRVDQESPTVA